MKKIFALLICLSMLTACEYDEYFESSEYPVENYEISNAVDGIYIVEYQERTGFPDQSVDIKIRKSNNIISEYSTKLKYDYQYPDKILYLFEYENGDFYYTEGRSGGYSTKSGEPFCCIVYDGDNDKLYDLMSWKYRLQVNIDAYYDEEDNIDEYWQEKLNGISEILQKNITEQEIIDVFDRCEYDSTYILEIYNYYKGEKEND